MTFLTWLFPKVDSDTITYSSEEIKIFSSTLVIGTWVIVFGIGGIISLVIWAYGLAPKLEANPAATFSVILGADLLISAAAAAAGALLGFIFAIPRTLDPAGQAAVANAVTSSKAASSAMAANTNLERISDWLTTLLIGAALVQIKDIARWVAELGNTLFKGAPITNETLVPVIAVYYFVLGFLGVYLITRLYLTFAFRQTMSMLAASLTDLTDALPTNINHEAIDANAMSETDDPQENLERARAIAKRISTGQAPGAASANSTDIKKAVQKAAADPNIIWSAASREVMCVKGVAR